MTEKEKMEKGELYDAAIPELIEQLLSTRDKIFELNHLRPSQLEERENLFGNHWYYTRKIHNHIAFLLRLWA